MRARIPNREVREQFLSFLSRKGLGARWDHTSGDRSGSLVPWRRKMRWRATEVFREILASPLFTSDAPYSVPALLASGGI